MYTKIIKMETLIVINKDKKIYHLYCVLFQMFKTSNYVMEIDKGLNSTKYCLTFNDKARQKCIMQEWAKKLLYKIQGSKGIRQ